VALGLQWNDLNQKTQNALLQHLTNFENKFRARDLPVIIFSYGKFGVTIQEYPHVKSVFLELTGKALQRFFVETVSGRDIGREV
jgi:hypothetical protein